MASKMRNLKSRISAKKQMIWDVRFHPERWQFGLPIINLKVLDPNF
jgi:hypothetical protein